MKSKAIVIAALSSCGLAKSVRPGDSLDPVQAVLLPDTAAAKNPLAHLGGNGPWHIGKTQKSGSLVSSSDGKKEPKPQEFLPRFLRGAMLIRLPAYLAMDLGILMPGLIVVGLRWLVE